MPPAGADGDGRQFLLRGLGDRTESLTAELLGGGRLLLTESAVSATLVATVAPSTQGFPPTRLLDALAGGAVALIFSQLLFPVHPLRVVGDAAESVVKELAETLEDVAG